MVGKRADRRGQCKSISEVRTWMKALNGSGNKYSRNLLGMKSNRTPGLKGPTGRGSRMMPIFCAGGWWCKQEREQRRRIRWGNKWWVNLEPKEFVEVIGFPVGSLKMESGSSKRDVYWCYNLGNPYSIWMVCHSHSSKYGLDQNHRKHIYLGAR